MEQLTLFPVPYRYIIDASSLISQNPNQPHTKLVYHSLWEKISSAMKERLIVTCSEIADEVMDKNIKEWLARSECVILEIDDEIQRNVRKIVTEHPELIEFTGNGTGTSSGDAFLLATAMKYGLIVVTEETPKKNKIPTVGKYFGVESVNITGLFTKEQWVI